MKAKKILFIISFIFVSISLFSQEAEKFTLVDTINSRAYEVQKEAIVKVQTDGSGYIGQLDSVTDEMLVVEGQNVPWADVESINFEDKTILKRWKNFVYITLGVNLIFTTAILLSPDSDGYNGMVIFLVTIPLLFISALFALIGFVLFKRGRTINYKNKKE